MGYYPFSSEYSAHYRLVGPDGAIATFNDPLDPNYVGMLTEVTGLDSPEIRESSVELVQADGGAHGDFWLGRRPIVMSGRVFGHQTAVERQIRLDRARRASLALRGNSVLSWKPAGRRENLVRNPRVINSTDWFPNFSSGLTGTSATHSGAGGRIQAVQPNDSVGRVMYFASATGATGFPVVPERSYHVRAQVTHASAGVAPVSGSRIDILWYKADGAPSTVQAQTSGVAVGANAAGVFTASHTATAPSDAAFVGFRMRSDTATANDVMDVTWTNAMVTETERGTTYFDGNTAGFHWTGTTDNSVSGDYVEMFTTVRRQQPFRESGGWNKDFQIALVSEHAYLYSTLLRSLGAGVIAENRGNMPAYPLLQITGPSTSPTVSDGTRVFRTTGLTVASGETVEFDTFNHTGRFIAGARNGQSANRYIDFAATAWPYLTGLGTTQTFVLTGGGVAVVVYRDTWA
jgi:hypothetical protein